MQIKNIELVGNNRTALVLKFIDLNTGTRDRFAAQVIWEGLQISYFRNVSIRGFFYNSFLLLNYPMLTLITVRKSFG